MSELVANRCKTHQDRSAVAKCPACSRDYCQECITEHLGRLICVSCIQQQKLDAPRGSGNALGKRVFAWGFGVVSFVALFLFFYLLGRILAAIPQSFHENMVF